MDPGATGCKLCPPDTSTHGLGSSFLGDCGCEEGHWSAVSASFSHVFGNSFLHQLIFSRLMAQKGWRIQTASRLLVRVGSLPGLINVGSASVPQCTACPEGVRCPLGSSLESLKTGQTGFGEAFTPRLLAGYFSTEESGALGT